MTWHLLSHGCVESASHKGECARVRKGREWGPALFLGSSVNLQIECDKSSAVNLISIHKSNSIKVKEMSVKSSREKYLQYMEEEEEVLTAKKRRIRIEIKLFSLAFLFFKSIFIYYESVCRVAE